MKSYSQNKMITPPRKVVEGQAWQYIDEQRYNKNKFSLIYIEPKDGYFYCTIVALDRLTGIMLHSNSVDIPFHAVADMAKFIQKRPLEREEPEIKHSINWDSFLTETIIESVNHPMHEIEYHIMMRLPSHPRDPGKYVVRVHYPRWSEDSPVFDRIDEAKSWIREDIKQKES